MITHLIKLRISIWSAQLFTIEIRAKDFDTFVSVLDQINWKDEQFNIR
jgi:hypothetical protein